MEIDRELVKTLLDLATGSMDFGSGFWDEDDTLAARAVATELGLDPNEFTPSEYLCRFPHPFQGPKVINPFSPADPTCLVSRCYRPASDPVHAKPDGGEPA